MTKQFFVEEKENFAAIFSLYTSFASQNNLLLAYTKTDADEELYISIRTFTQHKNIFERRIGKSNMAYFYGAH